MCVCAHASNYYCWEKKQPLFQLLSGSYQNGTDHLPLLSYQCAVNCLSETRQGSGGGVGGSVCISFFACLLAFSFFYYPQIQYNMRQGSVPGIFPH